MSASARTSRPGERQRDPTTNTASGTLFVVATPIGNLEDITLRALRILRDVAVIAAEDTRRTAILLRHYGIQTPLVSVHAHNERQRTELVLARLRAGDSVALVSDAGTPGISDPGALLVRAVRDAAMRVDAIPGASSITAALSASGIAFDRFAFAGFPPIRGNDRKLWLAWIEQLRDVPVVCFEAPHRIRRTLVNLSSVLGKRPITVARELTKAHETWLIMLNDLNTPSTHLADSVPERGEFVVIIAPEPPRPAHPTGSLPDDLTVSHEFWQLTSSGGYPTRRAAIKAVADRLGVSTKAVYDSLERGKKTSQT